MSEPARLLFVHIPKTAGMSLYAALAGAVGVERSIRFADASKKFRQDYLAMTRDELRRYRLISGHFPLPFFRRKPIGDYHAITVLRSPVDRELSSYFFLKTWEPHPKHSTLGKLDLYQYLDERESRGRRNPQCMFIAGAPSFEAARKVIDAGEVLAAPLEQVDGLCGELHRRWGIGPISLSRDNATKFRLSVDEIHPSIRKRFEALTEEDAALYAYVRQKFGRDVAGGDPAGGACAPGEKTATAP